MPSKRGAALKSKVVGREKKFEADHHRAEKKRRRREAERQAHDEGRSEVAEGAPAGEKAAGR